jgi:hypothetical protein
VPLPEVYTERESAENDVPYEQYSAKSLCVHEDDPALRAAAVLGREGPHADTRPFVVGSAANRKSAKALLRPPDLGGHTKKQKIAHVGRRPAEQLHG